MKRRIAIPVTGDRLSKFFGECDHCEIFDIDGKAMVLQMEKLPAGTVAGQLPGWLEENGITDVIVHRMNPKVMLLFSARKVNLFIGIPIDTPKKLLEDYLQGKLESNEKIIQEITCLTE